MAVATQPADPAVGDVYREARGGELHQLCYVDEEIVVLRCESGSPGRHHHRLERRQTFEDYIESERFELQPDSELNLLGDTEQEWSEVGYIGEQTEQNLYDAGYKTTADILAADDDELLDVDGLGHAGLSNLREYVR